VSDDTCTKCGHPSGPHVLACTLRTAADLPAGGHMYCPVAGCDCHNTWSIPDEVAGFDVRAALAAQEPPDRETVRRIRGH
jgi:hypothetical protein